MKQSRQVRTVSSRFASGVPGFLLPLLGSPRLDVRRPIFTIPRFFPFTSSFYSPQASESLINTMKSRASPALALLIAGADDAEGAGAELGIGDDRQAADLLPAEPLALERVHSHLAGRDRAVRVVLIDRP